MKKFFTSPSAFLLIFCVAISKRGCGCGLTAFVVVLVVALIIGYFFLWPRVTEWWEQRPPPPSGDELRVHVLNVGQGDAILIQSPTGKTVLVDAGETGDGKVVLDAMRRHGAGEIDLFIASHAHADHIGGADEVIKATTVKMVLDSVPPPAYDDSVNDNVNAGSTRRTPARPRPVTLPTTKAYTDFLAAVEAEGAEYRKAEPGQTFDLGGGASLSILAPTEPLFTKDQLRSGGNEPNANSVIARLDYGGFSMLLTGDAEAQTEERLINKGARLEAKVLKVGHHGSKYATSEALIRRMKPETAIISNGEANRYGHPSQPVLDRLRAANVRVYRTDLHGEITITSRGEAYEVKPLQETPSADLWTGREPERDDSAQRGFIAYGDFGPPKQSKEKLAKKDAGSSNSNSRRAATGGR